MSKLAWLHLSDWHQRGTEFPRRKVRDALIKDIRERCDAIERDLEKLDFVVFSGDLAFHGCAEEYQAARTEFLEPVLEAAAVGPERLFIVPGNHDLERSMLKLLPGDLLDRLKTRDQVSEWLTNERTRRALMQPMQAYCEFVASFVGAAAVDQRPAFGYTCRFATSEKTVALIGLNSAWLSARNVDANGEVVDRGHLVVGEFQVHDALRLASDADVRIAVMHHSCDWLVEFDRRSVGERVGRQCHFILVGHEHFPQVNVVHGTSGNYVVIPCGASYDRDPTQTTHASAYNLVCLDFRTGWGTAFLRRWSDRRGEWVADTDSSDAGRFSFALPKELGARTPLPPTRYVDEPAPEHAKVYPPYLHDMPPVPYNFVGRRLELGRLITAIRRGRRSVLVLRGMAGVGKTTLALRLAHELGDLYPDAQLYLDLKGTSDQPLSVAAILAHVIHAYRPTAQLPQNEDDLLGLYRSLLYGQRALLLMDDAASAEQVRPLIPPDTCLLIVTSRQRFAVLGAHAEDVHALTQEQASDLLVRLLSDGGREAPQSEVQKICALCGYLPLALRLAAAHLTTHDDETFGDYLTALQARRLQSLTIAGESVAGALDLSAVGLQQREPDLALRWRQLGVFYAPFDRAAAAAVLDLTKEDARAALNALCQRSLLEYDPSTQLYALHDLLRAYVLMPAADGLIAPADEHALRVRYAEHYLKLGISAETAFLQGGDCIASGLATFAAACPHLQGAWEWMCARQGEGHDRWLSDFASEMINVIGLCLHPQQALLILETALVAARRMNDQHAAARHLGNSGHLYGILGDTRHAVECYEQAGVIARELGDRSLEASAVGSLGAVYLDMGDPRRAIKLCRQQLEIARTCGDRTAETVALTNLGLAHARLGDYARAQPLFDNALEVAQAANDRLQEAGILGVLGDIEVERGDVREGVRLFEQQLDIARDLGLRAEEAVVLTGLGRAYVNLGHTVRGKALCERALEIARQLGDRKSEGYALDNLGAAYTDLGEPFMAIRLHEEALRIARERRDNRLVRCALGGIGNANLVAGHYNFAVRYYEEQLDFARQVGDRKGEAFALAGLGSAHLNWHGASYAMPFLEQGLQAARDVGSAEGEARTAWHLGSAYALLGEFGRAVELMEVLVRYERVIDHAHVEEHARMLEEVRRQSCEWHG